MRVEPGAVTIAHDHAGMKEVLIVVDGDLVDDDEAVFHPSEVVCYDAATHHNSRTETGCTIVVFEWRRGQTSVCPPHDFSGTD